MPDLEGLSTAIAGVVNDDHPASAELQKLGDQVKSLSHLTVTPEQIDAISMSLTNLARKMQGMEVEDTDTDTDSDDTTMAEPARVDITDEQQAGQEPSATAARGRARR
jgi:hypothetical protein